MNFKPRIITLAVVAIALGTPVWACEREAPATPTPESAATATATPLPFPTATLRPSPTPTRSPTPMPAPEATEEVVRRITEQVSGLRGLAAMEETPTFFISSEQMAERVRQLVEEEYTQEEADIEAELFALLDFIEPDTDLKEMYADLYVGSVIGYYDTDTEEMFVLSDGDRSDPAAKHTLAHEIVHALQDQTFDLDAFLPEGEANGDMELAKVALVEGDAVLAAAEYLKAHLTRSEIRQAYTSEGGGNDLSEIPRALIELLTFPYREGTEFVTAVHGDGGWASVDAAYSNPPLSTEHILHPDKYFAGEEPVIVDLPALALGRGWEVLEEGALGEFVISLYLENRLPGSRAARAGESWGGDAYALVRNEELDESGLASLSVWDTEEDAQEFFEALVSYYEEPRGEARDITMAGEGVRMWDLEGRCVYAGLEGNMALLIVSESEVAVGVMAGSFGGFSRGPETACDIISPADNR